MTSVSTGNTIDHIKENWIVALVIRVDVYHSLGITSVSIW